MQVTWSDSKAVLDKPGTVLAVSATQSEPQVTWGAQDGKLYTIVMTDPDAPSRADPKYGEWRHWVVVNVPGHDVAKGQVLTTYMGPAPPKGTGLHRYVVRRAALPHGSVPLTAFACGGFAVCGVQTVR